MADTSEGGTGAQTPPGPGVDASGQAVVDPTLNVKEYVALQVSRQDDLRDAEGRHLREILALRAEAGEHERECGEEIADLRAAHLHETAHLRAKHDLELRSSEAERIDAIRQVDVEAVQRDKEVQAQQAAVLDSSVRASAEAMREQVARAAEAAAANQAIALGPITKAIEDLRRSQYEAQGQKTQVVETQARGGSTALWIGLGVSALVLVLLMIGTVVTVVTVLLATQ